MAKHKKDPWDTLSLRGCLRGGGYPFVSGCIAGSNKDDPRLPQGLPFPGQAVQLPRSFIKLRLENSYPAMTRSCEMQQFLHNSESCHHTLHHANVMLKLCNSMSASQGKADVPVGR